MADWRPDGWGNPWSSPDAIVEFDKNLMALRTADGTAPERVLAEDRRDIYEAGASAMLAALREQHGVRYEGGTVAFNRLNGEHGTLVFIPDAPEEA